MRNTFERAKTSSTWNGRGTDERVSVAVLQRFARAWVVCVVAISAWWGLSTFVFPAFFALYTPLPFGVSTVGALSTLLAGLVMATCAWLLAPERAGRAVAVAVTWALVWISDWLGLMTHVLPAVNGSWSARLVGPLSLTGIAALGLASVIGVASAVALRRLGDAGAWRAVAWFAVAVPPLAYFAAIAYGPRDSDAPDTLFMLWVLVFIQAAFWIACAGVASAIARVGAKLAGSASDLPAGTPVSEAAPFEQAHQPDSREVRVL